MKFAVLVTSLVLFVAVPNAHAGALRFAGRQAAKVVRPVAKPVVKVAKLVAKAAF